MQRGGGGINDAAERGEASGFGRNLRGLVGRWPDADVVLQGGMSDGLRDWDLWYVYQSCLSTSDVSACTDKLGFCRGPLIFCLVLSLFLSVAHGDQSSAVFSGVFCIVWLGEAAVTLQIKLLGGKMYVENDPDVHSGCLDYANTILRLLVPSSSQSASSATHYSHWLLLHFSVLSAYLRLSEFPSILCLWHGPWQPVLASWAVLELSVTAWVSRCIRCSCSILPLGVSVSSVRDRDISRSRVGRARSFSCWA